jgi:hypothetical protein
VNGEDLLSFASAFGITGTFHAPSGTLTLSGTATPADHQTALRSEHEPPPPLARFGRRATIRAHRPRIIRVRSRIAGFAR